MTDPTIDRLEDAYEHLIHDVQCMLDSELYARWKEDQSFFNFSSDNIQRILEQMPSATRVATEANWKQMGRTVNATADPILILAPRVRSPTGTDVGTIFANYKLPPVPVEVYDISQTRGLPLISLTHSLTENNDQCKSLFQKLTGISPVRVEITCSLPSGYCGRQFPHKILIREGLPAAHGCMLLAYWTAQSRNPGEPISDLTAIQDQAVAYIVLRCYGIDSSPYSIGFIIRHGGVVEDLETSRDFIVCTAHDLLLEMSMPDLVQQQEDGVEENSGLPLWSYKWQK